MVSTLAAVGLGLAIESVAGRARPFVMVIGLGMTLTLFVMSTRLVGYTSELLIPTTSALALGAGFGLALAWSARRQDGIRVWIREALRASAIPMTIMALLGTWLLPTQGSPQLTSAQQLEREERWKQVTQLTRDMEPLEASRFIVVGDEPLALELAALLGTRTSATGSAYWGLGDERLAESGSVRASAFLSQLRKEELDRSLVCTTQNDVLVVATSSAIQAWGVPAAQSDDLAVWIVDCRP